jgi:hypothetical protein
MRIRRQRSLPGETCGGGGVSECPEDFCPHGVDPGGPCPADLPYAPLRERVAHLRVCRLLPVYKIAALTGIDRETLNRLLYEIADEARPGGRGWRTARQAAEDEWLDQALGDTSRQTRMTAPPSSRGPSEIELLTALYADPEVRQVLEKHGVPMAIPAGPIWRRFPAPMALTADLVSDLYEGCGLGLTHIGLVTGRTSGAAGAVLRAKSIRLRPVGVRSPFMRRWRQRER